MAALTRLFLEGMDQGCRYCRYYSILYHASALTPSTPAEVGCALRASDPQVALQVYRRTKLGDTS